MGLFDPQGLPSSPSSQTTTSQGLSPWAQPYVSDYLNKAQNLVANQQTPELLNQSYLEAKNLQLPGGFASGSALAQAGGQGSLSTVPYAYQFGNQGAQYGAQGTKYGAMGAAMGDVAARAGDLYSQQATDSNAIAQYMSPYMQNVVDWQKQQAVRDYQIQAPQMAAQAAAAGAFGGNRLALQQSEANRGLQNRLAGIEATGQQTAFDQARQAQQFGAQLGLQGQQVGMQGQQVGLQGLGTAMQGQQIGLQGVGAAQQGYGGATTAGGTLGNIASQEAQARLAALALKNQFGLQQQQFPYQQLQFQQGMLSGLPVTQQNTQTTQAAPNNLSQALGLGGTLFSGYALGKLANIFKEGGEVKRYAEGGDVKDIYLGGQSEPLGYGKFEQDQIDLINQAKAAAGTGGGMLGAAPQTAGMLAGGNNMSPQGLGAAAAGLGAIGLMPAPQQDNSAYLNSLYQNMFGRQADQGGFQHNLNLLNSGKINQQALASAFMNSAEGQSMPRRNYLNYAEGGITSINRDVINDPTSYSPQTINRSKQNGVLGDISALLALNTIAKQKQNLQNQQALQAGAQQPGSVLAQLQAQAAPSQGIETAQSNLPREFAGGGIIAFDEGGDVPRYYDGGAPSAFREDVSSLLGSIGSGYRSLNRSLTRPQWLEGIRGYLTRPNPKTYSPGDVESQEGGYYGGNAPVQTAPVLPAGDIVIHPSSKTSTSSGVSAGGGSGITMPSLDYTLPATDYSAEDKAISEAKRLLGGAGEDYEKAQKMAGISALLRASLALGGGASPYFMQNLNAAGQTGLQSWESELQRIQASKEKQAEKLAGIELKTPEMRRAAREMGLKEAEAQVKVPYYKSGTYENLAKGFRLLNPVPRGSGAGGLGTLPPAIAMKLDEAYEGSLANPLSNPAVLSKMSPEARTYLEKANPKTKSYQNALTEYKKILDIDYINKVNKYRMLNTKGSGPLETE